MQVLPNCGGFYKKYSFKKVKKSVRQRRDLTPTVFKKRLPRSRPNPDGFGQFSPPILAGTFEVLRYSVKKFHLDRFKKKGG